MVGWLQVVVCAISFFCNTRCFIFANLSFFNKIDLVVNSKSPKIGNGNLITL